MRLADRHPGFRIILSGALAALLVVGTGCASKPKAAASAPPRYAALPPKQVPAFLHDTIMERTDLIDTEPKLISGFGVVAHLHNTADNTLVPQTVRGYIIREMVKRGFGSKLQAGFEDMQPEEMLRSPCVSTVTFRLGRARASDLISRFRRCRAPTQRAWRAACSIEPN